MAKVPAPLLAFNAGEVSKIALGRIDLAKMRLSAECQVNWLPFVIGPMMLRPGLQQILEVKNDAPAHMVDFVYVKDDTAMLHFTANVMRVAINDVLISRSAVATTVADPTFTGAGNRWNSTDTTAGCSVTVTGGVASLFPSAVGGLARIKQTLNIAGGDQGTEHGLRVVVSTGPVTIRIGSSDGLSDYLAQTAIDTGTHSLAFTPTGASAFLQIEATSGGSINGTQAQNVGQQGRSLTNCSIEAAGVMELPTPWGAGDLPNLRAGNSQGLQSGDEVFVGCYGQQQQIVQRRGTRPGARGFSIVTYKPDNGPFIQAPAITANLTPSVYTGNGSLTSDRPYFQAGHVGALFRVFSPGQVNLTTLGALGAFTEPIRVTGVGTDRKFAYYTSGTWSGLLTLQRSLVGPLSGFAPVATVGANQESDFDDSGTLNNVVAWYRVGFANPGDYVSGAVTVYFGSQASAQDLVTNSGTGFGPVLHFASVPASIQAGQTVTDTTTPAAIPASTVVLSTTPTTVNLSQNVNGGVGGVGSGDTIHFAAAHGLNGSGAPSAGGKWGTCRVSGYNSSTSVNIEVLDPFSTLTPSTNWQEGAFSAVQGFPSCGTFDDGRLWWFGARALPIVGSESNGSFSFRAEDSAGTDIGESGAILEDFGSGPVDRINFAVSLTRILVGREMAMTSAFNNVFGDPITVSGFQVKDFESEGAQRLPGLKVGKRAIYVQQSNRRIYEAFYNVSEYDFDTRDLTRLNIDIGKPGFVDCDVAFQPDRQGFFVRGDGDVAVLLYDVKDEVEGWWRLMTFGVVENVRVLPSASGIEDQVYFVVKRTINGATKRFVEKLALRDNCVGGALNHQLDCFFTYTGAAVLTVDVSWLPNTLVSVWADGAFIGTQTTDGSGNCAMPDGKTHTNIVVGLAGTVLIGSVLPSLQNGQAPAQVFSSPQGTLSVGTQYNGYPAEVFADVGGTGKMNHIGAVTVSSGLVTLPNGAIASTIVAIIGYAAAFQSSKLAYAAPGRSPILEKKKIASLGLVMYDAHYQGLQFGQRFDMLDPLPLMEEGQTTPANTVWSEYDEPVMAVPGDWDTDARLCLLAQAPLPVKVGAAVVEIG